MSSSLGPSALGQYLGSADGGVMLPAINIAPDQLPDTIDQVGCDWRRLVT